MNIRDKSIITGLYLSKYSHEGLNELGFKSFQQAFNILGFSLGTKPASLKNYRDEFDPLFPNGRKGWHKRAIRDYCKKYFDEFNETDFVTFTDLIKSFFVENFEIEKLIYGSKKKDYSESIAKRLMTGRAAEEYFKSEYSKINIFSSYEILDTTQMACGFDYKLTSNTNFFCVEVKGLNSMTGTIQLTEKEFSIAKKMKTNYCLFIVKNFKEKPTHQYLLDPLNSRLNFKEIKKEIIQTTYNSTI
ncbi:MAG: DUF3883 domain-containing protein [Flavobacteriales bacterium]|nr:DUF3883 domain-containing protein [Flavobacteriales bacterium]MCB9363316.1 DUF3883 domain-containing protein [Flavobacteriales bacterium]